MRQANGDHTTPTPPSTAVTENTHAATVALLKGLADRSAIATVTEGPVHPDQQLLDLADMAMQALGQVEARIGDLHAIWDTKWTRPGLPIVKAKLHGIEDARRAASPILRQLSRTKATTPAGIVAKALVVRLSRTGAPVLARSLAEDLLASPAIRRALMQDTAEGGRS